MTLMRLVGAASGWCAAAAAALSMLLHDVINATTSSLTSEPSARRHLFRNTALPTRDGKESEPSKNEPNQNPGFAKNRTEHEPKILGSFPISTADTGDLAQS